MEYTKINKKDKIYCPNCEIHGVEKLAKYIVKSDAFGNIETPLCNECLEELIKDIESEELIKS